jgi:glycosyltransferase involved in cell wall biosynthesis
MTMATERGGVATPDRQPDEPKESPAALVSVIIPCYRQAHFLGEAIESALAQTYPSVEIIVVNDGSPDDTTQVAARYPGVRCIQQHNAGLAAARNTGLAHSRGDLVVFLDADDRLLPDALRLNADLLASHPQAGFVAGRSDYISGEGTTIPAEHRPWPTGDVYAALLERNRIRMPAMVMFRRSTLDRVGGFDTAVDACADYDLYLRVSREFPVAFHDATVAEYRRHGQNMSLDAGLMLSQLCHVLRQQRTQVRGHTRYREALDRGARDMRDYYGDQLADRIRERVRTRRDLAGALADAIRLLALHPRGFFAHAFRKTMMLGLARPQSADAVAAEGAKSRPSSGRGSD